MHRYNIYIDELMNGRGQGGVLASLSQSQNDAVQSCSVNVNQSWFRSVQQLHFYGTGEILIKIIRSYEEADILLPFPYILPIHCKDNFPFSSLCIHREINLSTQKMHIIQVYPRGEKYVFSRFPSICVRVLSRRFHHDLGMLWPKVTYDRIPVYKRKLPLHFVWHTPVTIMFRFSLRISVILSNI